MKVLENKYFRDLTSFHTGGGIRYYAEVKDKKDVEEAVCFAKSNKLAIFIVGGGNDFLASDKTFNGLVIKFVGKGIRREGNLVTADAGTDWDKLVEFSVKNNLQGIECLSGIPGTVGASPIQNIGAYGQDISGTFLRLTAFDLKKEKFEVFNKGDCKFGYRESVFKERSHWQRYLIIDVTLKLKTNGQPFVAYDSLKKYLESVGAMNPGLKEVRQAVLAVRSKIFHLPKLIGNAGSFFKSPVVSGKKLAELQKVYPDIKYYESEGKYKLPAGWLIEKAGWKGKIYKEAGVSPNHALVLINRNNKAKSSEVLELSEKIINDVDRKFGVKLVKEVQLINF